MKAFGKSLNLNLFASKREKTKILKTHLTLVAFRFKIFLFYKMRTIYVILELEVGRIKLFSCTIPNECDTCKRKGAMQ